MKNFFLFTLLFFCWNAFGQNRQLPEDLYKFTANEVDSYAWKSTDKHEKTTEVPEKWKNESAVFLYMEYYYESKQTTNLIFPPTGKVSFLAHFRIKLLDKNAVDNFSTLYYSASSHGNFSLYTQYGGRAKDFLGIKVIKPDGTEKVVNSQEFIKENGKKKVAVPGLEVGDIIDYYLYTCDYWAVTKYKNFYSVIDKFALGGKYPVEYFKDKLVTDKNWEVRFTTGKYGPKIMEKRVGKKDHDYEFLTEASDINSIKDVIWNYPYLSSPYVKMYVKYHPHFMTRERADAPTYRISKLDDKAIIDFYTGYYAMNYGVQSTYQGFQDYLKKTYGKVSLSKEKLLEEYYYYIRHEFINRHYVYDRFHESEGKGGYFGGYGALQYDDNGQRYVDPKVFTGYIIYGLHEMHIPYELLVVQPRYNGTLSEVVDVNETDYMIRADLKKPVYFYKPSVYTDFNELPASVQGTESYVLYSPKQNARDLQIKKTILPVSDAHKNTIIYNYSVAFDPDSSLKLDIDANVKFNGLQMYDYKQPMVDYIHMIWDENDRYGTKKWGDRDNQRKKFQVQMDEFVRSEGEKRKKNFEKYAKDQFGTDNLELTDFKNETTGNEPGDSNLVIDFSCKVEDLVKKVGNNFLLKAGKLLGGQITLDEKNQERIVDVYMDYARGYEYNINVKIPKGYEVKGLDAFRTEVRNSTGCFTANAKVENGILELTFTKYYYHNFEKKEDWQKMKAFLVPASLLSSKELLFEKI